MGLMGPIVAPVDEVDRMDVAEFMVMVIHPFHLCCLGADWAGPGNGIPFLAFTI